MNAYEKEIDEREYMDWLDEIYEPVQVGNSTFDVSRIIKELDPIAFRCGMADMPVVWVCGECDTEYDDEDEAEDCCVDED